MDAGLESISHRMVEANGIKIHLAEKGSGPAVLLIHGFPELWYSWRHQISGLADRGYRALAPDLRGYGDTISPGASSPSSFTMLQIVGDLIGLLDALGIDQVFVVGHDWGANVAWNLCLFRGDRVRALVALSVCFRPRNPSVKPMTAFRAMYGEDYYICRFQELGAAEADFAQTGTERVLKIFLTNRNPGPFILPKGGLSAWPVKQIALPKWFSEKDIHYYTEKFNKSGFTGGLNYYRALDSNWELTAAWTGAKIKVPAKYVVGDLDLTYNTMGTKEYINSGGLKRDVPLLEEVVVVEGVGHFINEERPDEITDHILSFIGKH